MSIRRLLAVALPLAACATAVFSQSTTKTTTITQNYTFPPVGVASNETLQINLANTAVNSTSATPVAASCTGTVTVTNASGAVIGKANPFTVAGSNIQSITIPYANLGATGSARAEVLVSVQRSITLPPTTPCNLIYSLETFLTTTGETHLLLGNTATTGVVPVLTGILSPVPPTTPPGGGN